MMHFHKKYFFISSVFFILISTIFYYVTKDKLEYAKKDILKSHQVRLKISYDSFLYYQEIISGQIYEQTVQDEKIISLLKRANKYKDNPQKLFSIRQDLKSYLDKPYEIYKYSDVLQFQFVFPNNVSFLRMHKPEIFGDDLTNLREDFQLTNKIKMDVHEFVQSGTSHGFRNIYPIFDEDNNYISSVEISFPANFLQNYLSIVSNLHSHFLIDKKIFNAKIWKKDNRLVKYAQSVEHEGFIVEKSDEHDIKEHLKYFLKIKNNAMKSMKDKQIFAEYVLFEDTAKVITFLPVKQIVSGKVIAWIVGYEDDDILFKLIDDIEKYRVIAIFIILFFSILLYRTFTQRDIFLQAQKKFKIIFDSALEGIILIDIKTNKFMEFNFKAYDMLGYSENEYKDFSLYDIELNKTELDILNDKNRLLEKGVYTYITKHKAKDRTVLDINVSMKVVNIGGIDTIQATFHDITEEKNLQRNLKKQTKKAHEASKIKSDFLANMSHEIRTPMNGIIGLTHLVLKTNLNIRQSDYLKKIDNSATSLLGIINDILDISKIEAGKLTLEYTEFDLFKTIDTIVDLVEFKTHEKNLELVISYDTNMGKLFYGDSLRISQIITNLLSNAVKFTDYGEIGVFIKKIQKDRYRFEIKDTGIGLTKEQQAKLFQAFSQADNSTTRKYGGTGLGLTISQEFVNMMDGKIWIESELGKGSSFIFEITLKEIEYNKQYSIFSDKQVLVVDDNEVWHDILEDTLNMFKIKSIHAYSGQEALDILKDCKKEFDLILIDWNMSGLDGIETVEKLATQCGGETPMSVIMVSSFRKESISKLAKNVGIDVFLQKPINPSVLNDILTEIFVNGSVKESYIELKEIENIEDITVLAGNNLLLVEDNETNQIVIEGLLEDSGINIDIANNGQEGVNLFKQNKDKYQVILMDLQMPVLDGFGATKLIREIDKNIPIFALTANVMKEDVIKTKLAGMNEHLHKPIDIEVLNKTLLKYLKTTTKQQNDEIIIAKESENSLPSFIYIDSQKGMSLLSNNEKLYVKMLEGFYKSYNDITVKSITSFNDEEFKRFMHTIKGLSLGVGASKLAEIAKELESSRVDYLIDDFMNILEKVLTDLKKMHKEEIDVQKITLDKTKEDELFLRLKDVVRKKRSRECIPILEDIEKYNLSNDKQLIFKQVKEFVQNRKFKEALEVFEG